MDKEKMQKPKTGRPVYVSLKVWRMVEKLSKESGIRVGVILEESIKIGLVAFRERQEPWIKYRRRLDELLKTGAIIDGTEEGGIPPEEISDNGASQEGSSVAPNE